VEDKTRRRSAAAALAVAIAIPAEGLRQWAYYDPPGILTVCYGSPPNFWAFTRADSSRF
jgi:GH24 family phage-related lysozyme (muramidase)